MIEMQNTIYYFTGTGNSLSAARAIGEKLGNCTLIPIPSVVKRGAQGTGVTGIVFPLYFCGLPEIVLRFVEQLDLDLSEYAFAVVTRGGGPSRALHHLQEIFRRNDWILDAGFLLNMPGNYTPMYDVAPSEKQQKVLHQAQEKLLTICETIERRESHFDREPLLGRMIGHEIYHMAIDSIHGRDSRFHLTEGCTSCGICASICPVGNVTMEDGLPVWHGNCQQCLACFHFCSERVIQHGQKTIKRGRYHHPDVRSDDIARQRMGIAENYGES